MPAREIDAQHAATEPQTEAPAPVAAPAEAEKQFTTEGDLPAIATSAGAATGATASEQAFGDSETPATDLSHLDKGVHDWQQYKYEVEKAGKPEKWQAHYANGHTEATGWVNPYEKRGGAYEWELKPGHSASEALKAWLAGPTISDYRAYGMADEVDEVRSSLGDRKFDKLFGSANETEDKGVPKAQRLRVSSSLYTTPIGDQMKAIAAEYDANEIKPAEEPKVAEIESRQEVREPEKAAQVEPEVVRKELGLEQADRELV